jgi:hypothetical protein
MIGVPIEFVFLLNFLLGLLALDVLLQWQQLSPILRCLYYILFGSLVVLCMLGLLILGNHLGCWLTTAC